MQNIQILSSELAQKIAAGEVVERPYSVVKELVENALDAKATHIQIEIEDAGKKRITVQDNGVGIADSEVLLALERHATSKIKDLEDLWGIHTLGFRGEALPSIASVSRFTLETHRKEQNGKRVYLEGGKLLKEQMGAPCFPENLHSINSTQYNDHKNQNGTRVSVEDLFYNVPARLKFLKSKTSEMNGIRDLVDRLALCNPEVQFTLINEGKKTLEYLARQNQPEHSHVERATRTLGAGEKVSSSNVNATKYNERVSAVLKSKELSILDACFEDTSIQVWYSPHERAQTLNALYFSVNGRVVKDKLLSRSVMNAFKPTLMEGEFPKLYLKIEVPVQNVDVNVHPAKSEVRFRKPQDTFQVIYNTIAQALKKPDQSSYLVGHHKTELQKDFFQEKIFNVDSALYKQKYMETSGGFANVERDSASSSSAHATSYSEPLNLRASSPQISTPSTVSDLHSFLSPAVHAPANLSHSHPVNAPAANPHDIMSDFQAEHAQDMLATKRSTNSIATKIHYIGQLKNTYLLFQDHDGLVVIDQHAAHERINYERIKNEFLNSGLKAQLLLVAITIKCTTETVALALDYQEWFLKFGYEIDAFGENCLLVRSSPQDLDPLKAKDLFEILLESLRADLEIIDIKDPTLLSKKLDRVFSTAACHSSIRAGQTLSSFEAKKLLEQMECTEHSLNCPHGRPASIKLNFDQIEKFFKRS